MKFLRQKNETRTIEKYLKLQKINYRWSLKRKHARNLVQKNHSIVIKHSINFPQISLNICIYKKTGFSLFRDLHIAI
jgi:hypothetical protein